MRLVMGLDYPDAGQVTIGGRRYRRLGWPLAEVGALLEARTFHPGRSARAHLLALAAAGGIARSRGCSAWGSVRSSGTPRPRSACWSAPCT